MIRVVSSQSYETCPAAGGRVLIEAPSSRLDGSLWPHERDAADAIKREQMATRHAIDTDIAQGGPLMRGLALFSLQLHELGWEDLDLQIDLASRIVVFPDDAMLSIPDAHAFLEALILDEVCESSSSYAAHLQQFQQTMFAAAAP